MTNRAMRSFSMFELFAPAVLLFSHLAAFTTAAAPSPISLNFGTQFLGSDGLWSAAQIRVGTPEQWISVFPNTVSSETWVIGPGGCGGSLICEQLRGGIFSANESTTYQKLGTFDFGHVGSGLTPLYADYGLDNLSVSDTFSAPAQVIATVTDPAIWLGQVGLSVQESQFNDRIDHLSFISTLVQNESAIPSHSYGYTAGAHYALKSVPGSLVLGGVDTTRFTPNHVSFSLSVGYVPKVAIQDITVTSSSSQGLVAIPFNWNSNPVTLLQSSQAALFTIDTSTPYLWLPVDVCDAFAAALNLTYSEELDLYVFRNDTNVDSGPSTLNEWGLSFTFTLADLVNSTQAVELSISYDAFDLQISYGFPGSNLTYGASPINYFPLRRANSSSQYVIGRALLQESYLTVDYERNNFSLSQALFPDVSAVLPNIVPITRPARSTWAGPQTASSLSTGARAGIGVGVAIAVLAMAALVLLVVRRRGKKQFGNEKASGEKKWKFPGASKKVIAIAELLGDRRHPRELLVDSSDTRFELPGPDPVEMPAEDVSDVYLTANQTTDRILGVDGSPQTGPSRLDSQDSQDSQSSIRKDYNIRATVTERPPSPAPPYSPSEVGQNTGSGGVGSFDSKHSGGFGSHDSSGAAISPIVQPGTRSPSDGDRSPISPVVHTIQTTPSTLNSSSTQMSDPNASLATPSTKISRTASRNSRFREELTEEQEHNFETLRNMPPLRPRFSWEE